jgi:hypothetical protein
MKGSLCLVGLSFIPCHRLRSAFLDGAFSPFSESLHAFPIHSSLLISGDMTQRSRARSTEGASGDFDCKTHLRGWQCWGLNKPAAFRPIVPTGSPGRLQRHQGRRDSPSRTSSVSTENRASCASPNESRSQYSGVPAACHEDAADTGWSWRASNVYHRPPTKTSNQARKSIGADRAVQRYPLDSCAIAGRVIHASAQPYGEMGEVPADTHPLLMPLRRGPIASSVVIAELNTTVNIVANGLDALPATRDLTKEQPSQVAQLCTGGREHLEKQLVAFVEPLKVPLRGGAVPRRLGSRSYSQPAFLPHGY